MISSVGTRDYHRHRRQFRASVFVVLCFLFFILFFFYQAQEGAPPATLVFVSAFRRIVSFKANRFHALGCKMPFELCGETQLADTYAAPTMLCTVRRRNSSSYTHVYKYRLHIEVVPPPPPLLHGCRSSLALGASARLAIDGRQKILRPF